jgi:PLP dependent protein
VADVEPVPGARPAEDLSVGARLDAVRRAIVDACAAVGRAPDTVTLIAVSKTFPPEPVLQAIRSGHLCFGENRVQEATGKWTSMLAEHPAVELHLVGPLQRNKVAKAIAIFRAIHTVDRTELCEALARHQEGGATLPELLVQVNTGSEPQKSGVLPGAVTEFVARCQSQYDLRVSGLMCIPPVDEPPSGHFELMARLAAECGLRTLSMGMSGDYELAIRHGATHVRVGSAIFGTRNLGG